MIQSWYIILNPVSGNGRAKKTWSALQALGIAAEGYAETTGPRHAETLVHQALTEGHRHLLILGGDGTIGETHHALLNHPAYHPDSCTVAFIPCGTGNDWSRTLRIPQNPIALAEMLVQGKTLLTDVGVCTYQTANGPETRHFANVAGLGFDAYVAERYLGGSKQGIMRYMLALLRGLGSYRNLSAALEIHSAGEAPVRMQGDAFLIAGGMGQYFGGGMRICPAADPADGKMSITAILDISKPAVMGQLPRLYSGAFVSHPAVRQATGTELVVTATTSRPLWMQADGELLGFTPVAMRVKPAAVRVVVP